jgi:hypothetical protein
MDRTTLTYQELSTVLAALRYWQANTGSMFRDQVMPGMFQDCEPLDDDQIDELAQRLNTLELAGKPPQEFKS